MENKSVEQEKTTAISDDAVKSLEAMAQAMVDHANAMANTLSDVLPFVYADVAKNIKVHCVAYDEHGDYLSAISKMKLKPYDILLILGTGDDTRYTNARIEMLVYEYDTSIKEHGFIDRMRGHNIFDGVSIGDIYTHIFNTVVGILSKYPTDENNEKIKNGWL